MKLISLSLVAAMLGGDGSVSGTWRGSFRVDGGDHDVPQVFVLDEHGQALSGTGGPDESERYPIAKGRVEGDAVRFELTTGEWKFFYDLKDSGQVLNGKVTLKSASSTRTASVTLRKSR